MKSLRSTLLLASLLGVPLVARAAVVSGVPVEVALSRPPVAATSPGRPVPGESSTARELRENPLRSRNDVAKSVRDLFEPMRRYAVDDGFHLGEFSAGYSLSTTRCEAFLRPFWGLVPLTAGKGRFSHWAEVRRTLVRATDPKSPAFWGLIDVQDQRAVEMAPLAVGLVLAPEELWTPLSAVEKKNLENWLRSIERCPKLANNWIFFRVLVHLAFDRLGLPYDKAMNAADLAKIDSLYLENGWYMDGPTPQRDYYIPMAMHFYGLIYAKLAEKKDPERAARFKERSSLFAAEYQHWFTPEGDALPYGRSLTYRFAQGAFWSALAFSGVEAKGLSRGQVKGLFLRHLRWWFRQPILGDSGLLTVGYGYPNQRMAEFYNAPGSPYWAEKAFLALALPESDPFWTVKEEPLPARPSVSVQAPAGMILVHDDARSHTVGLASGQLALFMPVPSANKYAKFAYSSKFGFCVAGPEGGVDGGGLDSTLSLGEDELHLRSRELCESVEVRSNALASRWKVGSDAVVESWIAPVGAGHVRIHRVRATRPLVAIDAGFCLPSETQETGLAKTNGTLFLTAPFGFSAVADLKGGSELGAKWARPGLNVLHSRARFPFVKASLSAGETWLASAVCAIPEAKAADEVKSFFKGLSFAAGAVPEIRKDGVTVLRADPLAEGLQLVGLPRRSEK